MRCLPILLLVLLVAVTTTTAISFGPCPGDSAPASMLVDVTWTAVEPSVSSLDYSICSLEATNVSSLRYIQDIELVVFNTTTGLTSNGRVVHICNGSNALVNACLDQLKAGNCLTGTIPVHLSATAESDVRSEIRVRQYDTGDVTRACSV